MVLAQHRSIDDPELGGQYTVKLYQSDKAPAERGEWRHTEVRLLPASTDPSFQPMTFTGDDSEVRVIAELKSVLADLT